MKIISLHISKLLLTNDKVIINGLGYFVAAEQKAYHHPVSNDFTPKNKRLSFYLDKKVTSPLLAEAIGGNSAEVKIQVFVLKVITSLKHNNDVVLYNLGVLKKHEKGHIVFIQSDEIVFDKNFFGMEAFNHDAPVQEKIIETPIPIAPPADEKRTRSFIYWFAIPGLVASLVLAYVFVDFNKLFGGSDDVGDTEKVGIEKSIEPVFGVDTLENAFVEDDNSKDKIIEQNIESAESVVENDIIVNTIEQEVSVAKTLDKEGDGNYYIMAGCFKSTLKAKRLLKELKKGNYPNASINGKTRSGLIRVCYDDFSTEAEAERNMVQISEKEGKELWMQKIGN